MTWSHEIHYGVQTRFETSCIWNISLDKVSQGMAEVKNELEGQWELSCIPSVLGVNILLIWNDVKMLENTKAQTTFTQFSMKELNFFLYNRVKIFKNQFSWTDEELRKMFDMGMWSDTLDR
ncbi:UNVERIFIED_CONTAM: hypothetical protein Sindi_0934400, partial [Sesamum indicum]